MGLTIRMACVVAALAAVSATAYAQEETTGSAEQGARRRTLGGVGRGAEYTTATFEQYWERTQQAELEAAGIPEEKIEQLKQMELEARMALSRGERPNLGELRDRRREILTPEEMKKISEIRRTRRDGRPGQRDGATTGPRGATQAGAAETTPTAANE